MFSAESLSLKPIPSFQPLLSAVASIAASTILLKTISNDLLPDPVAAYFHSRLHRISSYFSSQLTLVIEESDGLTPNQMFHAANLFLGSKLAPSTRRIKAHKPEKEKEIFLTVDKNQELVDVFRGVRFTWVLISTPLRKSVSDRNQSSKQENWCFEVSFHKKHRDMALISYLPHILHKADEVKEHKKTVKLHTVDYNGRDYWSSISLDHPATFDTIAMEPEMKEELIQDLNMFIQRKELYKRVGKAWKRGYLLYGPPGTGKSSLVAAMANYLEFDVYDLDLKEVQCNSDLRRLLIGTGSRSIVVLEDIDSTLESAEEDKVTLAGLLSFTDGLWSSCGDERIIVFTTNHKDRLDPVLLRPGRMDMHIHMSYCSFSSFRTLASNYLQLQDHPVFSDIKELLEKVQATPAEVSGELMKNANAEVALKGLIRFLMNKAQPVTTQ